MEKQPEGRRIVIVDNYYYGDKPSAFTSVLKAYNEQGAQPPLEVFHTRTIWFTLEDDELVCHLPDGTFFSASSSDDEKPMWVMDRSNSNRVSFMLEQMGVKCFPCSYATMIANDKALSHALLADVLSAPDSILMLPRNVDEEEVLAYSGKEYPYIMKTVSGHGGTGVHKVYSSEQREEIVDAAQGKTIRQFITQKACARGDDLRVYVMEDEIVGAVLRKVSEGHWQANYAYEPEYIDYELTDEQKEAIIAAANKFPRNRGLISIDFLFDEGKMILCEPNTNPAIDALAKVGKSDGILEKYIEVLDCLVNDGK